MAYNKLFADKDEYELVKGWYERRASLESSILRRQVEILYKTFASRQGNEGALRRIEELEAEANAIYSNYRGAVGDSLLGRRSPRRLYLRRRRAADLPDLPDNAAHRHLEDGASAPGEARHRQHGFESFLINLYVACFALIALTG